MKRTSLAALGLLLLMNAPAAAVPAGTLPVVPSAPPIAVPPPAGVAACGPILQGSGEVVGNVPDPHPNDPAFQSSSIIIVPSNASANTYISTIRNLVTLPNPAKGATPGPLSRVYQGQVQVQTSYLGIAPNVEYSHVAEQNGAFDCQGIPPTTYAQFDIIATIFESLPVTLQNLGMPCSTVSNPCSTVAKYYYVSGQALLPPIKGVPQKTVVSTGMFQYIGSSPAGYSSRS